MKQKLWLIQGTMNMQIEERLKGALSLDIVELLEQAELKDPLLVERFHRVVQLVGQSEDKLKKIFQYSNDAIFIIDPHRDRILDANPVACDLLGYSLKELLATPISAIHPNEMPKLQAFAQSVLEDGSGWSDQLTCTTKMGQTIYAEMSASVLDLDGNSCIVVQVREVNGRKRAEQELRSANEYLERQAEERTLELRMKNDQQEALLRVSQVVQQMNSPEDLEKVSLLSNRLATANEQNETHMKTIQRMREQLEKLMAG